MNFDRGREASTFETCVPFALVKGYLLAAGS